MPMKAVHRDTQPGAEPADSRPGCSRSVEAVMGPTASKQDLWARRTWTTSSSSRPDGSRLLESAREELRS